MSSVGTAPKRRSVILRCVATLFVLCCAFGAAQPPDDLDDRPPLPPEEPKRPSVKAQFRYPNPTRRIFDKIEDDVPVRSEKKNADEYQAWTDVILTVKEKVAADLEDAATRDLTPDDLLKANARKHFRLELVRFDGTLTRLRKLPATKALQDIGILSVFQGWLVPDDESPANPVCVVITDLPAGLEPGPELNRRVSFAGYFFKAMAYPGPDYDPDRDKAEGETGWRTAPLLVGRSVTPQAARPANPDAKIDKNLRVFRMIKDDTPMNMATATYEEASAWNRVLLHARRFSAAELEAAARRDVEFHSLFRDVRRDYKLDLVYFEGELIMLRKVEPGKRLSEAGVDAAYEGWLVPKDEPSGNPLCISFTELPEGLSLPEKPTGFAKTWVSFAGYSFKLIRYESNERDRKTNESKWKRAPLLLGRGILPKTDPTRTTDLSWAGTFVPMAMGVLGTVVGVIGVLTWVFRRGDRKTRKEIEAGRKNPFSGTASGEPGA